MDYTAIFERVEMKYVLSSNQYQQLMTIIREHLEADVFPHSEISSIYFDNNQYSLIRKSLEHPAYKEKLRLRSYCEIINDSSPVFLELKKKYHGVTYKRRQEMTYRQAKDYILYNKIPCDSQIMKEIDCLVKRDCLVPKVLIAYSRDSYVAKDDDLRITFDQKIGFDLNNLLLDSPKEKNILTNDEIIMELKSLAAMPLWFAKALDQLKIYPNNFSKYGTIYQQYIMKGATLCSKTYSHQYSHQHLMPQASSFAHLQV